LRVSGKTLKVERLISSSGGGGKMAENADNPGVSRGEMASLGGEDKKRNIQVSVKEKPFEKEDKRVGACKEGGSREWRDENAPCWGGG